MNKNKFRFWNPHFKDFQDCFVTPIGVNKHQQCIGILDSNMKEIYEGDVVKFDTIRYTNLIGEIRYSNDYCAYVIDSNAGIEYIWETVPDSLEIVGNIMKDYIWNEKGELVKQHEN